MVGDWEGRLIVVVTTIIAGLKGDRRLPGFRPNIQLWIHTCIIDTCIMETCIMDVEMDKEVLVNFAWVTRTEHPKGAKDDVKRPKGPPARSLGPEGP